MLDIDLAIASLQSSAQLSFAPPPISLGEGQSFSSCSAPFVSA